jgi:hypothetical protein
VFPAVACRPILPGSGGDAVGVGFAGAFVGEWRLEDGVGRAPPGARARLANRAVVNLCLSRGVVLSRHG